MVERQCSLTGIQGLVRKEKSPTERKQNWFLSFPQQPFCSKDQQRGSTIRPVSPLLLPDDMPPVSFNLKQKLAALSLGPSSPYSPNLTNTRNGHGNGNELHPRSPTNRRKTFSIPPSWVGKPRGFTGSNVEISLGEEEKRLVQDVLARMIFQAGVDFECALIFP